MDGEEWMCTGMNGCCFGLLGYGELGVSLVAVMLPFDVEEFLEGYGFVFVAHVLVLHDMNKPKDVRFEGFSCFFDGLVSSILILEHVIWVYWLVCFIVNVHNNP